MYVCMYARNCVRMYEYMYEFKYVCIHVHICVFMHL